MSQSKYNNKCLDMEIGVERIVLTKPTRKNISKTLLEDMSKKREGQDKRKTEAYKYAPAKQRQIMTGNLTSYSDKTKIQLNVKPEILHHDKMPVEHKVWME